MKTAELKAATRKITGGKSSRDSRRNDKVPAVVYGESGVQHVEVDYIPMAKLIQSADLHLINLEADGKTTRVIIQDAQFHPVSDRILHVDFLEAAVGRKANLSIPINVIGTSQGVLNGGQLVVKMRRLKVRGVPSEMPEHIDIDITGLEIGKSIKVADLEGYEVLDPINSVIVRVKAARKMEELVPALGEEEGAEGEEGATAEGAEGGEAKAEGGEAPAAEEKAE
jgi:large subunit ribosomal protein L25